MKVQWRTLTYRAISHLFRIEEHTIVAACGVQRGPKRLGLHESKVRCKNCERAVAK